jgi:hypothetical protein
MLNKARKQMKQRFYTFLNTCFSHNNKETLLHISNRKPLGKEKGKKKNKGQMHCM